MGYLDHRKRADKGVFFGVFLECDVYHCFGITAERYQNDLSDTSLWLIVIGTKWRGPEQELLH